MAPRGLRVVARVLACTLMAAAGWGCGDGNRRAGRPEAGLSPWEGQLQELFDDQIHPAAVGVSMDARSPARDPLLRLRTIHADVVARLKVQTVTRDAVGARASYSLSLSLVGAPFTRPKLDATQFDLVIRQDSPAFGLAQYLEGAVRDKRTMQFIGFIRKFPAEEGPVLHWHLTADTEEVAQVVQEVAVLDEIKGAP